MSEPKPLPRLLQLAGETSTERRRELLREITDLFLDSAKVRSGQAGKDVDAILQVGIDDLDHDGRSEIADRFVGADHIPSGVSRRLMADELPIAEKILVQCHGVAEADLMWSASRISDEHLTALAHRRQLPASVGEIVVKRGGTPTLRALVANETATLSRRSKEILTHRAESEPSLHAGLVAREDMDLDLLNEMYFIVDEETRGKIVERGKTASPEMLQDAMEAARTRLQRSTGALPSDYEAACRFVEGKKLRKALNGELLLDLLELGERTKYYAALAELTGLEYRAARRVSDTPAVEPIAAACRSAGVEKDTFLAIVILRPTDSPREEADPDSLGAAYEAIDPDIAQHVLQFWRLRAGAAPAAA